MPPKKKFAPKSKVQNTQHFLPALNGLIGDKLDESNPLTIKMSFRKNGNDVTVENLYLDKILKGAGRHVIVFVHGLMLDERCWQGDAKQGPGYGTLLEHDIGYTALYVRYNSGLHISQNGRRLAQILQKLIDLHGARIGSLTLVGFSMGALIVRSAGHYGKKEMQTWIKKLSRVVLLGAPHSGSHWEQLGHLVSFILKTIWSFHTRLIGRIADQRSNGIKDLRLGFMIDEDWQHRNAANLLHFKRTPLEPLAGTRYHLIAGSLHHDEKSALTSYFGDGLVGKKSAFSEKLGTCKVFTRTSHFQLLNSRAVYNHIKECLGD